jgi:hypothetical protein
MKTGWHQNFDKGQVFEHATARHELMACNGQCVRGWFDGRGSGLVLESGLTVTSHPECSYNAEQEDIMGVVVEFFDALL